MTSAIIFPLHLAVHGAVDPAPSDDLDGSGRPAAGEMMPNSPNGSTGARAGRVSQGSGGTHTQRSPGRRGGRGGGAGYDFQDVYVAWQLSKLLAGGGRDPVVEVLWEKSVLDAGDGMARRVTLDDLIVRHRSGLWRYTQAKATGHWSVAALIQNGVAQQFWDQWRTSRISGREGIRLSLATGGTVPAQVRQLLDVAANSRTSTELASSIHTAGAVAGIRQLAAALSPPADLDQMLAFARVLDIEQLPRAHEVSVFIVNTLAQFGGAAPELADRLVRIVTSSKHAGPEARSFHTRATLMEQLARDGFSLERLMLLTLNPPQMQALVIGVPFRPSATFVGRSVELDQLRSMLLGRGERIALSAAVEGLGGIGKTELVLQLVNDPEIQASFGAVIWLDGAGPLPPQWAQVGQELGMPSIPEQADKLVRMVGDDLKLRGETLLVLDNASDWRAVEGMIPTGLTVLATTRIRDFGGTSFRHTELGVLSDDASREYLTRLIPSALADPGLPRLVELLGGHALALELAAYHIRDLCSIEEYVTRLVGHQADFSLHEVAKTRYDATVDSCLQVTWDSLLRDQSRLLWRRASLFAPVPAHRNLLRESFIGGDNSGVRELLEEVTGNVESAEQLQRELLADPEAFDDAYAELRGCHILARVEGFNGERWSMHRLVRAFGRVHLNKYEVIIHAMSLAEWLRNPNLPVAPEAPHFVAAILDSAREGRTYDERRVEREITHRLLFSRDVFYAPEVLIEFIRAELQNPKALAMILEGMADVNADVRFASIRLLERMGPVPEVLSGLTSALGDPDPRVRTKAGETLAQHGTARTVELLTHAARGANVRARLTAVRALGLMGSRGQRGLISALENDEPLARIEAATLLCEQGRREGVDIVLEALPSGAAESMSRLIEALAATKSERAVPVLCKCLAMRTTHHDAASALRRMGSLALGSLLGLLQHREEGVRLEVAILLAELGRTDGIEVLLEGISSARESWERNRFVAALAATRDERALPVLLRCLEEVGISRVAVNGLRLMGERARAALRDLLRHPSGALRIVGAMLLAKLGSLEGIEILIRYFDKAESDDRRPILKVLAASGDERAVPIFFKYLAVKDGAGDIARQALRDLGKKAHPALIEAFQDRREVFRLQAAVLLAEQGLEVGTQVILGDMESSSSWVRDAAAVALRSIKESRARAELGELRRAASEENSGHIAAAVPRSLPPAEPS